MAVLLECSIHIFFLTHFIIIILFLACQEGREFLEGKDYVFFKFIPLALTTVFVT